MNRARESLATMVAVLLIVVAFAALFVFIAYMVRLAW